MMQMQKLDAIDVKIIRFHLVLANLPEFQRGAILERLAQCREERRQCAQTVFKLDSGIRRLLATDTTTSPMIRGFVESALERAKAAFTTVET
jgi:hypothetical protein